MTAQNKCSLPEGWTLTTIQEFCEKVTDGSHNPPKAKESGLPMLSAKNIAHGKINFNGGRLIALNEFEAEDKRTRVSVGDVLLTTVATLGRTAIVDESCEKFTLQRSVSVLGTNQVNSKFLKYSLDTPEVQSFINMNARGNAQKGFYIKQLKELQIKLAPLAEQKRIIEKLDSLLAQVDTIQQRLNNLPNIIKRFRQSVLAAAVSGKLTEQWRFDNQLELLSNSSYSNKKKSFYESKSTSEQKQITKIKEKEWFYNCHSFLPAGWVDSHLIDITSVITCGVAKKPNYIDNGVKFLSAQNVKPFLPNLNKYKYISQSDYDTFTKGSKPEKGDILYSRVGANFGEACVIPWDFDFAIYVSLTLIKPNKDFINENYLTMFLNSKDGVLQSRGGIMGSGIQNLNVENVRKYRVPLPSLKEQSEIVRLVDQHFALANTLEKHLKTAKQRVDNLTQSILAKAFKGELVPQDPNDEPAEQLLARIKAARLEAEKLEKVAKKVAKTSKAKKK